MNAKWTEDGSTSRNWSIAQGILGKFSRNKSESLTGEMVCCLLLKTKQRLSCRFLQWFLVQRHLRSGGEQLSQIVWFSWHSKVWNWISATENVAKVAILAPNQPESTTLWKHPNVRTGPEQSRLETESLAGDVSLQEKSLFSPWFCLHPPCASQTLVAKHVGISCGSGYHNGGSRSFGSCKQQDGDVHRSLSVEVGLNLWSLFRQ